MTVPVEVPGIAGDGAGRGRWSGLLPVSPAGNRRFGYVAALDGMRGLAVMAVLLYHADVPFLQGGYLGVDAFFVLSGYLITTLVIREHGEAGQIDLRAFWARRAVRLLPAMFALLGVLLTWFAFFPTGRNIAQEVIGALGYVTNWQLITSGDSYFEAFQAPSPLQHAWSLAIEEQFYLFWPVVAVLALGAGARQRLGRLALVAAAGAVASIALMAALYEPGTDPSRIYYGTDTRAQSLLIGALAAVVSAAWPLGRNRWVRVTIRAGAVVAAPLLVVAWVGLEDVSPLLYRGGFAVVALAVVALTLAAVQPGPNPFRDAFSWPPLVTIGVLSYGLYLWHWPLYLVINERSVGFGGAGLVGVRLAAAALAGVASYHLVEMPVRKMAAGGRISAVRVASAMPVTLVVLLVVALGSNALVAEPAQVGFTDDELVALGDAPPPPPPPPPPATTTTALAPVPDGDPEPPPPALEPVRTLVLGDSVAVTLGLGFGAENLEAGLLDDEDVNSLDVTDLTDDVVVWNRGVLACSLFDEPMRDAANGINSEEGGCPDRLASWAKDVARFEPEAAMLSVGPWEVFDRRFDGRWVSFGSSEFDDRFAARLDDVLDVLTADGAQAVLVTAPAANRDPTAPGQAASQVEGDRFGHLNALLAAAAARRDDTDLVDLAAGLCEVDLCGPGDEWRYDGLHFSVTGANTAARWMAPQLVQIVRR